MIIKGIHLITFFLLILQLNAQTYFSQTEFDLGEIVQLNEDVVDLNLSNQGNEDVFILRIEARPRTSIKYTSKNLEMGSAQLLRIKLNPTQTGKFKEQVKIYLSSNDKPIILTFKGVVKAIPKNNKTACPNFSGGQRPQFNYQLFQQQKSGEQRQFFVELTSNKEIVAADMEVEEKPKPVANAQRVEPKAKKNKKTAEERRNSPSLFEILFGNDKKDTIPLSALEHTPEIDSIDEPKKDDYLLSEEFKPNNVVFLIDASTSMREEERMEILKLAMIKLLEPLRAIDYLSIVTYSGEARVLLAPTSAIHKEEIIKSIENIIADGSTHASKGIKKAIQVGKSNFLEEGNNQIILATDGAFNIGERNQSLRRKIKSTAKEGLTITVLGIKNERWTNKSLKEIVELGKGNYLKINSKKDATKVLEEVKKQSRK